MGILHNAFATFVKYILPPFYALQQMSVFLWKENTAPPGSLRKVKKQKLYRHHDNEIVLDISYDLELSSSYFITVSTVKISADEPEG